MARAEAIETPDALPRGEVVILGEVHDNSDHHAFQARAIKAIAPAAVVFEMVDADGAEALAAIDTRDARAVRAALDWDSSGWPDFDLYAPVFAASAFARLYGAEVPRDEVRRAMTEGAAGVLGPGAAALGLDLPLLPDDQAAREADQMAVHCDALPPEMLPGMVEAQRLRDAALARAILQALDDTGGPVAVITGNGHARRDQGIPAYLAAARPELTVVTLGQFEAAPEDAPPYDVWHVTAPTDRPDPCAAFR